MYFLEEFSALLPYAKFVNGIFQKVIKLRESNLLVSESSKENLI